MTKTNAPSKKRRRALSIIAGILSGIAIFVLLVHVFILPYVMVDAADGGNRALVRALLFAGIDPNFTDEGHTPLMCAAWNGHTEIAKILIASGADPNRSSHTGGTALMSAANMGYLDVVRILLNAGADVNAQDTEGNTALMDAAVNGNSRVVELLIQHRADVKLTNKKGQTALTLARKHLYNTAQDVNPHEPTELGEAQKTIDLLQR